MPACITTGSTTSRTRTSGQAAPAELRFDHPPLSCSIAPPTSSLSWLPFSRTHYGEDIRDRLRTLRIN